jgi:tryptophan halogenase
VHALPFKPNIYGIEGYLAHLIGMKVPFHARHEPTPEEKTLWEKHRRKHRLVASAALTSEEALAAIRKPGWSWK